MSSGCCHPKIFFLFPSPPVQLLVFTPLRGTKNPRSRFIYFNSASQSFVSYAVSLPDLPAASTTFYKFFSLRLLSATPLSYRFYRSRQQVLYIFFGLFPTGSKLSRKEQGAHNSGSSGSCKSFFQKNFIFFAKAPGTPQIVASQCLMISFRQPEPIPAA